MKPESTARDSTQLTLQLSPELLRLAERSVSLVERGVTLVEKVFKPSPQAAAMGLPAIEIDDLSAARARRHLESLDHPQEPKLFTRKEAARYTRRSPHTFDKTIRPQLDNVGTAARPLYRRKEVDQCLERKAELGLCESTTAAHTGTRVSHTRVSVTRSPQAQEMLEKLRSSRPSSTPKS